MRLPLLCEKSEPYRQTGRQAGRQAGSDRFENSLSIALFRIFTALNEGTVLSKHLFTSVLRISVGLLGNMYCEVSCGGGRPCFFVLIPTT